MNAFAAAMDALFQDANMAAEATWTPQGGAPLPVRVVRKAPDEMTAFGAARILSETNVIPVSPEAIDALLDVWPLFESFQTDYVAKGLVLDQEKNVSSPLPSGSSAGAETTARAASPARPARKPASTAHKS